MNKSDLRKMTKDELIEHALELTEKIEELMILLYEKDQVIQEHVARYWSWDEIKKKFDSIDNISESLAFLDKILAEKAICSNKECPIFPLLWEIEAQKFSLEQNYSGVFDIETAKKTFRSNKAHYNKWSEQYWDLRFKLNKAYQEIKMIGIPNESKLLKVTQAHERSLQTIEKLGEAGIPWHGEVGHEIDDEISRNTDILRNDDPDLQKRYYLFDEEKNQKKKKQPKPPKKEMIDARLRKT